MIELALSNLTDTLTKKNSDYKVTEEEFSNFYFASEVSDVPAKDIVLAQIGIKLGRIKGLRKMEDSMVNFESLLDSLQDLAGYAVILYALGLEEL